MLFRLKVASVAEGAISIVKVCVLESGGRRVPPRQGSRLADDEVVLG